MNRPNFFIVGAPKCGTTALASYLISHPMVFRPRIKEPNYFCEDFPGVRAAKTEASYLAIYDNATEQTTCIFDASVCYLYSKVAVQNIHAFDPQAKLAVMLRNPVDLVYSLHAQNLYSLNEDVSDFSRAWSLQPARRAGRHLPRHCREPFFLQYEMMGRVSRGLETVFASFPRDQVKVMFFDDLVKSPEALMTEVFGFLGLPQTTVQRLPAVNANKELRSRLLGRLTQREFTPVLRTPLRNIKNMLGFRNVSVSAKLAKLNQVQRKRAPLPPEVQAMLEKTFADEITALESLTGRDLSSWRSKTGKTMISR